jgi:hypothetical protein
MKSQFIESSGRHEAEQLEMPLAATPNPLDSLLKEDPILELINQAKSPLEELRRETHHESIMALIEIEHAKISANRFKAVEELEKLVAYFKFQIMRSLGRALAEAKEKK